MGHAARSPLAGPPAGLGVLGAGLLVLGACGGEGDRPDSSRRSALPFAARAELPTAGKPEGVLAHDFDGDGRAELVAATRDPGSLHIWTGFDTPPIVVPLPDYPLGPELVRAGAGPRVALACRSTNELLVLDPLARDPLAGARRIALPGRPRAFGAGALEEGAEPVLAVATREGELVVARGDELTRCALLDPLPTFVDVRPGVVIVGSQEGECVRAYRLAEDGSLTASEKALGLGGIPRDHALFDLDGDGAREHVFAAGDATLRTTRSLEAADLTERRAGAVPIDLEANATRLFVLAHYDLSYTAFPSGAGPTVREYAGQDPWDAAVGDLDGDGLDDLAFANRGARRVSVVLAADESRFREAERIPTGRGPHALASGDLDGDGEPEILVVHALVSELALLRRRAGRYEVATRYGAGPAGDRPRIADLDGDGRQDVAFLVRDASGARVRVLLGDGRGGFVGSDEMGGTPVGIGTGDLALADLDGDGTTEAIACDPDGGTVVVLTGVREDGALRLEPGERIAVPSAPRALAILPARDGGAARVAVAVGEPGPRVGVALLEPSGPRALREQAFVPMERFPIDVAALDADGDGVHELAVLCKASAGDGPGDLIVLEEGTNGWSERARARTGLRPYAVAAGDFDGDGRDDLAVGAQNSHHVNVWRSVAGGLERLPDVGAGRGVLDVLLTDLTGDGRADLIVANNFSGDVSVAPAEYE